MKYERIRKQLVDYYMDRSWSDAKCFKERVFSILDEAYVQNPNRNSYQLKQLQYECIAEQFTPILFNDIPFYFETGALCPYSDGHYSRGMTHANAWVYSKNKHIFRESDEEQYQLFRTNVEYKIFSAAPYVDWEHWPLPMEKLFRHGLKGVYEEALQSANESSDPEEKAFLEAVMGAVLSLKQMAETFAAKAEELLKVEADAQNRKTLEKIKDTAARVPWNQPDSVYEGLCTMAFMRKALGSIEGVGFNSFGRVDVLLRDLYEKDRKRGVAEEELYDYICKFILIWDSHVDKTKIMSGYADYEYENALTLGGCDESGAEVFNKITELFMRAHMELNSMYPKIKCRYSTNSSSAYLELISKPLLKQQSIVLYSNDDVVIPALIKHGFPEEHAKNYTVSGCWDVGIDDYFKGFCGEYVNTLRALEWAMYLPEDKFEENRLTFKAIHECNTFEEVYQTVLQNILMIIRRKAELQTTGVKDWPKVSPVCGVSALMADPIRNRKDLSAGGARYNWECFYLAALPDTIDSLLAIKQLCFDEHICTMEELIEECKQNWSNEALRQKAMHAPSYGDGTKESAELLSRIVDDIYDATRNLPTAYGGKWRIGCYMYTEVIWWGKEILATPNGRRDGDYISQGLTPSRLHEIKSVTDVFANLKQYDATKLSSGSVLNVVLPATKMSTEILVAFLRGCASSNTHLMQINCVDKEELLLAQKEPERYGHIIVRVCGFSAPFTSLSKDFQDEFLTRNYYE
jgi:formate C-acetyltransferase